MGRIAAAVLMLALLQPSRALSESYPRRGLRQLRLSPDGHYILAQTDFRIAVLTVQPLGVLFQIPAAFASPSEFSPDSREIVFLGSTQDVETQPFVTYVERWSIADRKHVGHTAIPDKACRSEELSPDGSFLACVDVKGTLRLIDVASSSAIFEKKRFGRLFMWAGTCREFNPNVSASCIPANESGDPGSATFHFSTDGRFVVAMPENSRGDPVAFDVRERKVVNLGGGLRKLRHGLEFAFLSPDRVMVSERQRPALTITVDCKSCRQWDPPRPADPSTVTATLLAFPSGEVLSKPTLPPGPLFRAANPDFVLIRPFGIDYRPESKQTTVTDTPMGKMTTISYPPSKRAAAVEFATGQVIVSDTPALDVFRQFYVAELANGDVGLYERGKGLQSALTIAVR